MAGREKGKTVTIYTRYADTDPDGRVLNTLAPFGGWHKMLISEGTGFNFPRVVEYTKKRIEGGAYAIAVVVDEDSSAVAPPIAFIRRGQYIRQGDGMISVETLVSSLMSQQSYGAGASIVRPNYARAGKQWEDDEIRISRLQNRGRPSQTLPPMTMGDPPKPQLPFELREKERRAEAAAQAEIEAEPEPEVAEVPLDHSKFTGEPAEFSPTPTTTTTPVGGAKYEGFDLASAWEGYYD